MKLRPPSFLMLGMVRLGASSGYAIKRAADVSTRFFWPTSLAQVYPELARLEEGGFLTRRENPQGARARSAYELTEDGERALLAWLRSPRHGPPQIRDEGILRLFFSDVLPDDERVALVQRLRERAHEVEAQMREEIVPQAEVLEEAGAHGPAAVARLGADTYAFIEQWLARYEAELEGLDPPD